MHRFPLPIATDGTVMHSITDRGKGNLTPGPLSIAMARGSDFREDDVRGVSWHFGRVTPRRVTERGRG